jgi:predicted proteasome-type protease
MDTKLKNLIRKNAYRDVQIEMLHRISDGYIISRELVDEIIKEIEDKDDAILEKEQLEIIGDDFEAPDFSGTCGTNDR